MATLSAHWEKDLNGSQEKGLLLAFGFWKIPVHRREEGMVVGVAQSVLVGVSAQSQESSLKHSNLQRFIPRDILLLTGSHFLDYTTSPNGAMNLQQALKT